MDIEEVKEDELQELADLYQQLQLNQVSLPQMKAVLERNLNNPHHLIIVAKIDGKVVGSLLAVCCDMLFGRCRPFMVLEDVVVDQAHRRRGIGTALMRHVQRKAEAMGCAYIMLVADSRSPEPAHFYSALGYNTDGYRAFKMHINAAATE